MLYIFQFLEAQRIHNLTKYLQALHKVQHATEEHTTLLLNCYTKLKDVNKLDEYIMVCIKFPWKTKCKNFINLSLCPFI